MNKFQVLNGKLVVFVVFTQNVSGIKLKHLHSNTHSPLKRVETYEHTSGGKSLQINQNKDVYK